MKMTEQKSKMGRPKKAIDYETVEKLAQLFCTQEEIAAFLNLDVKTLQRDTDFGTFYKKGQEKGKCSLRRYQYECAKKGNSAMLIWLGKQYLGQSEKMAIVNSDIGDDELTKSIKAKMQEVKKEMKQ